MLYVGLMSGTSANAIDATLVDFSNGQFRMLKTHSTEYSHGLQERIEFVIQNYSSATQHSVDGLNQQLGQDFAQAVIQLLEKVDLDSDITAIGSHGQTIYHGPRDNPPRTVQIGDPQIIADLTGVTTIADFRIADIEVGGQGAPLAPAFHNTMFRHPKNNRVVCNIGGISNITVLPADPELPVIGFDTGPGNTLMDQWCQIHRGLPYDKDGKWASEGTAEESFVDALLSDPYFYAKPPKSTGREYFHLDWMKQRWPNWADIKAEDIQAGLLEVTARCIVNAITQCSPDAELFICGGGAHNITLLSRISQLRTAESQTTQALGLSPDWVEACAFAWLAKQRLENLPGNLPSVTGASRSTLLGKVFLPQI